MKPVCSLQVSQGPHQTYQGLWQDSLDLRNSHRECGLGVGVSRTVDNGPSMPVYVLYIYVAYWMLASKFVQLFWWGYSTHGKRVSQKSQPASYQSWTTKIFWSSMQCVVTDLIKHRESLALSPSVSIDSTRRCIICYWVLSGPSPLMQSITRPRGKDVI